MVKLDPDLIQKTLGVYRIPCQPEVLATLEREFSRPKPDLDVIALLINSDIALSGTVMQIANSKLFRTRYKVAKFFSSTIDAVHFIGLSRIQKIIQFLSKRDHQANRNTLVLTRFWDTALNVAAVSAHLAQRLMCASPDESFLLGFFRDCGVPYMIEACAGYSELFNEFSTVDPLGLPTLENEKFKLNHQVIGYCTARHWALPEVICRAILTHHTIEPPSKELSPMLAHTNMLASLIYVAELITFRHRKYKLPKVEEQEVWPSIHPNILGHLDIAQLDLHEMMEDTQDKMEGLLADYKP